MPPSKVGADAAPGHPAGLPGEAVAGEGANRLRVQGGVPRDLAQSDPPLNGPGPAFQEEPVGSALPPEGNSPPGAQGTERAERTGGDDLADGVRRPLDPRSIELARTKGLVASAVAAVIMLPLPLGSLATAGFTSVPTAVTAGVWLAATLLLLWTALAWPAVSHRHASYTLAPLGIEIRHGVIWRMVLNVPRSRVQHTDVAQGPLERRHGLGRLFVYTAGSSHARVVLHGLDYGVALRIRDFLLPRAGGDAV